jgi:hypothetical protein
MAITYAFFHDSALTEEITALNPITATQDENDTLAPVDVQIWFGSATAGSQVQADSDPGVDDIEVSIADSNGATGQTTTAIRLATSQPGLASATPGAALAIGTSVSAGSANAVAFWVRIDDGTGTYGSYTDLSLQTNTLRQTPV